MVDEDDTTIHDERIADELSTLDDDVGEDAE